MNILLLGKTGQIGFELHRNLIPLATVDAPDRGQLDLMEEQAVSDYLERSSPDLIVNAAAWTAVDAAELEQKQAMRLNAGLPSQLAHYASLKHVRLIHFSSDYVYAGVSEQPWRETSIADPLSVYGQTKLKGDQSIEQSGCDHLIFRTSWVYSARGTNFMKTMLRLGSEKREIRVVSDQIGAPTPARLIAKVAALAVDRDLAAGVYNLSTLGETSWNGFAQEIFRLAEKPVDLIPVLTEDYPSLAKRPLNSRLDTQKLQSALGVQLPDWQSQLALTLSEYLEV